MTSPRIAIIGAGHLGKLHAKTLAALAPASLLAVVDPLEHARVTLAEAYGARPAAAVREIVREVDAAILAAPSSLHFEIGIECLRNGLDLFVEKPLATTSDECQSMFEQAQRRGRILQVGHIERFNPAYIAAQDCSITPRYIETKRLGPYSFRSRDTGVVMDLMIHDLDLVLQFARSPVVDVQATGAIVLGPHEDIAHADLYFADGCRAHLSASRIHHEAVRSLECLGAEGTLKIDFAQRKAEFIGPSAHFLAGRIPLESANPLQIQQWQREFFGSILIREDFVVNSHDPITAELRDFLDAIETRRQPRVNGADGTKAVVLAEKIERLVRDAEHSRQTADRVAA